MEGAVLALSRADIIQIDLAGFVLVAVSATLALITAFVLRTRFPAPLIVALLAAAGVGVAWGGMLLREEPHPGEVVAAVVLLAVLLPAHVRIVLGPFGRRRAEA